MITEGDLKSLLSEKESDRIERTTSTDDTQKFSQAICAFSNDMPAHKKPGYLFIGVDDDGRLAGLEVTDMLLRSLGDLRSNGNILPQPAITVSKFSMEGGDVAVVEVVPSDIPPVRYQGRVYIRVGPRKAVANEQEERILSERRLGAAKSFDARGCSDASVSDLALRLFEEYRMRAVDSAVIAGNHRTIYEQLASLRFFDLKKNQPTVAGILLFGNNPRYFLPGAYVQFLKFPGISITEVPTDQAEITGDLRTVIDAVCGKFRSYNTIGLRQEKGFSEESMPDYPEIAFREIFNNAVMHRDYDSNTPVRVYWFNDRIEIQSPGGLYGEVTQETITTANSYRNPIVAEAMKELGYVNRFGYGIQRANTELKRNGNPDLEIVCDRFVCVTLRRRKI